MIGVGVVGVRRVLWKWTSHNLSKLAWRWREMKRLEKVYVQFLYYFNKQLLLELFLHRFFFFPITVAIHPQPLSVRVTFQEP